MYKVNYTLNDRSLRSKSFETLHEATVFANQQPLESVLEIKFYNNIVSYNNFRSLPNLKIITWNNFANNQLDSFALIKNIPTIKQLIYMTCLNIHELDQIKNWCESKGIRLEIK